MLEVTRSGYYAWRKRTARSSSLDRLRLVKRVEEIHAETRKSYGSRRISAQLKQEGYEVGRFQARSLMREAKGGVKKNRRFISLRSGEPIRQ